MVDYIEKTPPQDLEAEEIIIGSMLTSRDFIKLPCNTLDPGDFYRNGNGWTFALIGALVLSDEPADLLTVCDRATFRAHPTIPNGEYLSACMEKAGDLKKLEKSIASVKACAYQRKLIWTLMTAMELVNKLRDLNAGGMPQRRDGKTMPE